MSRKTLILGAILVAAVCGVQAATAQQADGASNNKLFSLSLEELLDIKVSGVTQIESEILWSPASLNIFDSQAIRLVHKDSLTELLSLIPGFHTARTDDYLTSSISVRGRRIGSSGREVLALIDGMRIDNWYSGGSTVTMPHISLLGLDKVEFIRGAVSQLYGSGAFTGVVNMVSDPSLDSTKVTIDEHSALQLQSNIGGKVGAIQHKLFLDLKNDGGEDYVVPKPGTGEPVTINDGQKITSGHYQAHMGDWSFYGIYSKSKAEHFYTTGTYAPNESKAEHTFSNFSLKYSKQLSENLHSSVQAGSRHFELFLDAEVAPAGALTSISEPPSNQPLIINTQQNKEHESWVNWRNRLKLANKYDILLGVEWRDIQLDPFVYNSNYDVEALSRGQFPIASSESLSISNLAVPQSYENLLGIYLQAIVPLGTKDQITVGLRQDEYKTVGSNTAPRIAWVHRLNPKFSIKMIYSEAFRAPAANELYLQNNPVLTGNPNLIPETVKTSELIGFYESKVMRFQLGYFSSDYQNPIGQLSMGPIRQFSNWATTRSAGIEGNISYQFNDYWIGRFNFSHLTEKPEDQYRLPDDLAGLLLTFKKDAWSWNYTSHYVGKRESNPPDSDNPTPINSYWQHNSNLCYKFKGGTELTLSIDNLTDVQFSDPSISDSPYLVPGRGRTAKLEYTFEF